MPCIADSDPRPVGPAYLHIHLVMRHSDMDTSLYIRGFVSTPGSLALLAKLFDHLVLEESLVDVPDQGEAPPRGDRSSLGRTALFPAQSHQVAVARPFACLLPTAYYTNGFFTDNPFPLSAWSPEVLDQKPPSRILSLGTLEGVCEFGSRSRPFPKAVDLPKPLQVSRPSPHLTLSGLYHTAA